MKYIPIALLWAAYCALHSFLISIRFTNLMQRILKNYYAFYRFFYVLVSLILLILLLDLGKQIDTEIIITYTYPWSVIRSVVLWSSLLMFFWAFFFNYDSLSFFGIRQILRFGKTNRTNPADAIKKNGLLGIVRHPMYLALILFLCCQTFKMIDIIVNIILIIYVIIGTLLEEKKLVLEFGDTYIKYQNEVPMLIPFLKK